MFDDSDGRYHRQTLITWWDQDLLADARVLVVGAGALGNEIVKCLALVGVGQIDVVDMDLIEDSNLSRCVFFRTEDIGFPKAEIVARRAMELNPDCKVKGIVGDVRLTVGLGAFYNADVVIGGLDSREARLFVNRACWKTSTPWVDGAIEGLMGVARVFVPPDGPCYECTLSEQDHALMAERKSCAGLTREEMLGGKVPTTATSASIIGGIEVQEAIKLIHAERHEGETLAGSGFHYVGVNHDSYVVTYERDEACMSHDTYDLASADSVSADRTFGEMLHAARARLGDGAVLDLEHEVAVAAECGACGNREELMKPVDALGSGFALCSKCPNQWAIEVVSTIGGDSPLLALTPGDIGLPTCDVVTGRQGIEERCFFLYDSPKKSSVTSP